MAVQLVLLLAEEAVGLATPPLQSVLLLQSACHACPGLQVAQRLVDAELSRFHLPVSTDLPTRMPECTWASWAACQEA